MANTLSEFEINRYKLIAKRFVEIYILEEPLKAGHYIQEEFKELSKLPILRTYVGLAFRDAGYAFDELDKVLED